MKRKHARKGGKDHRHRERHDEHAFLFGPDGQCLGRVERDEWDFAISDSGGNVAEAASLVGLEVPRSTRVLWGRSQEAAIGAYRAWLKRKAGKK